MPDFRAFLTSKEPVVLPYFGGTRVDAKDRRFRVDGALAPGWWRFAIEGRRAVPQEPAAPIELGSLPVVRGHWVEGWIVAGGRDLGRVALPPSEEPAPLARVTGRRWYSGELLLDGIDFEDDAELAAREALEQLRGIADVRGVVPSLRAAFGYALGLAVAREARVPVTLREFAARVVAIAEGGRAAAEVSIDALVARRRAAEAALAARVREAEAAAHARAVVAAAAARQHELAAVATTARHRGRGGSPTERADAALESAGARMLSARRIGTNLEVVFVCEGERIIATVDAETLHVYDSGICLSGADEELTLDSLPSAIKEAIETDQLNIMRR